LGREFVRVGYYVNNEYDDEQLRENPPLNPDFDRLSRNILAEKPIVTRFPIAWTKGKLNPAMFQINAGRQKLGYLHNMVIL
jgi:hypothetical protein